MTSKPSFFSTPSPVWLSILMFFILKQAFLTEIHPNDYWWYVRLGQDILSNGTIPDTDSYTFTQFGKQFVFHSWLSGVLFWLIQDQLLIKLLYGILLCIFYFFIWKSCRTVGAGPRLAMILTLLSYLASSNNLAIRPQIFSFPLFSLSLFCLLKWRKGKTNLVWILPVIALLWVNLHGAFPMILLLTGAAFVGGGGDRKSLFAVLSLIFLAILCNPRGIYVWQYVYTLLNDPASQLIGQEWQSPSTKIWQGKLFYFWILIFPIFTSLSSRKLTLTDWLWFVGFGWMAMNGSRYTVWLMTVFAPINALLLSPLGNRTLDKRNTLGIPTVNCFLIVILILGPFTLLPGIRDKWLPKNFPAYSTNTPFEAVSWIKAHPELPNNLWADLAMSSYLIYAAPDRPVWIDPRFELFPLQHWKDYYEIINGQPGWEDLLARDEIKLLLLDPKKQSGLIKALTTSPKWISPYEDDYSKIFITTPE